MLIKERRMEKKYGVIYADPPWQYKVYSKKGAGRSAESHYPTMDIKDICALMDAIRVMDAWGFTYKTVAFVWVKLNKVADSLFWGMGYWTRANAEVCVIATKGNPKRVDAGVHQIIMSHIEEHSRKPQEARDRIKRLMGDVPMIELFARQKVDGWDTWGNEVPNSIELQ